MNNKNKSSNEINISIGGNANNSTIVGSGGDVNIQSTSSMNNSAVTEAFINIYKQIESRSIDPNVDKQEITQTIQKIEDEVNKSEDANTSKLQRWLQNLEEMAPDIFSVVIATLSSPQLGITTVIQKIIEKTKKMQGNN